MNLIQRENKLADIYFLNIKNDYVVILLLKKMYFEIRMFRPIFVQDHFFSISQCKLNTFLLFPFMLQ